MCMEDVRIGRQSAPSPSFLAVPDAGNTTIAQQSPKRTALILSCPDAVGVFVSPQPLDPSAGQGILLTNAKDPIILDIQHHGTLVTSEWRASGNAGASSAVVLESILERE